MVARKPPKPPKPPKPRVTDHQILFMGRMVVEVNADRKDVTRRTGKRWARVRPGDTLYVRETWRTYERPIDGLDGVLYRADDAFRPIENTPEAADAWVKAHDNGRHDEHWRPSILMPRWASRTSLRVVSVTLQRADECTNTLNETRDDRIRCALNHCPVARRPLGCQLMPDVDDLEARREGFASRAAFLDVWNKLHPDYNGPVYRIEFARINR